MTLIVCIDDKNGMLFNHRRQSRDRVLIEDLLALTAGAPLWIEPYSVPLFPKDCTAYKVADDPLAAAGAKDFCF
ncbi:MAG: ribonuclease Z, partial [Clostridia bacterium]|nr:ribonuclease Z [Clostridia bacterium]